MLPLACSDADNCYSLFIKMGRTSYFALMRMGHASSEIRNCSCKTDHTMYCGPTQRHLDTVQPGTPKAQYFAARSDLRKKGCDSVFDRDHASPFGGILRPVCRSGLLFEGRDRTRLHIVSQSHSNQQAGNRTWVSTCCW